MDESLVISSLVFPWPKGLGPSDEIVARIHITLVAAWLSGNQVRVRPLENAHSYALGVDWMPRTELS